MWRKVVTSVLVSIALAAGWVWPAFSEPPQRPADCAEDGLSWGYDVAGRDGPAEIGRF